MKQTDVLMDEQLKEDLLSYLTEVERFLFKIVWQIHQEVDALWLSDESRKLSQRLCGKGKEGVV